MDLFIKAIAWLTMVICLNILASIVFRELFFNPDIQRWAGIITGGFIGLTISKFLKFKSSKNG